MMTKTHQSPSPYSKGSTKKIRSTAAPRAVRLSEAQQLVLVRASQRDDGVLIERYDQSIVGQQVPDGAFGSTLNDRRMIEGFIAKGLVEGSIDDLFSLRLTAVTFSALHIDESEWPERLQGRTKANSEALDAVLLKDEHSPTKPATLRAGSKGAAVLALLQREGGATLAEMQGVTDWQAHSVRGFLSGTIYKKLGFEVSSIKSDDGERIYRVCEGA
ncbi:DUF3489 domain-containing protein [Pseudahrensia aquimaris]|uniref:DUF3489 domain-containing protein n=1 Tax=Pseudahrensia aquimaris TaxID=744461 RepID=A0ABW3FJ35_9HYPH